MSSFFGSVWNDLVFSSGKHTMNTIGGMGYTWTKGKDLVGNVEFKSRAACKSVTARVTQRIAQQAVEAQVNSLFPKLQRYMEKKQREAVLAQTEDNSFRNLIENGTIPRSCGEANGSYKPEDSTSGSIVATDYLSRRVPEALIMVFTGKNDQTYTIYEDSTFGEGQLKKQNMFQQLIGMPRSIQSAKGNIKETTVTTKDLIHIDLNPSISYSSSNNIVMTQVQGRDFTRKELISGGDFSFSVSGEIVSNNPGEYPAEAVKRFVTLMRSKGIIRVYHYLFEQLGVKNVIIKDHSLDRQDYLNIQPYSFSCVAIETDDIILSNVDTIGRYNEEIALSDNKAWYDFVLNSKLAELTAKATANATNSAMSKGLDLMHMIDNI